MTDAQVNQETGEVQVTFTTEPPVVQQQSSSVSLDLVSKFINPSPDTESDLSELKQTNQFAEALSSILGIVDKYLETKVKDIVDVAVQLKSDKLREEALAENQDFLNLIDSNMKRIIKEQVKAQTPDMTKVEKLLTRNSGAEVFWFDQTNNLRRLNAVASSLNPALDAEGVRVRGDVSGKTARTVEEGASRPRISISTIHVSTTRSPPKSSGKSVQEEEHDPRVDDLEEPFHQEFDTRNDDVSPVREATDVEERLWNPSGSQTHDREWNQTKTVDDRPPRQWMTKLAQASGTTSSFNEFLATPINFFLEYHLEEIFKATNDQLDCQNPEGRPYPHDLSKPLPLIPDARDVYSKHRIIVVTSLKIMEFFGYKHLEEITVRRQDDKLYKFRKGDFKRLRLEDIEDMLLLLVQGKLTNLNVDEWFTLNVALRLHKTHFKFKNELRLQLAVESYQKKINLNKPDTYHSDISKKTPYTAYRDIQSIIYQDDMNKNCLMRSDELHKFSDGTLNHARTSLNVLLLGDNGSICRRYSGPNRQAETLVDELKPVIRTKRQRLIRSLDTFCSVEDLTEDTFFTTKDPYELTNESLFIQTEMELTLEQTQQGVSYEVSVSIEGVEE
ncbi:hypothetical protein Tco_0456488 [Tanacetum coccineum]